METKAASRPLAVVTGASGGIGFDLAQLLAADGHDLVLVARGKDKLQALASELEQKHGAKVHVLAHDLSDPKAPKALVHELEQRGLTVEVLVNNAGFAQFGPFVDTDVDQDLQVMQLNMVTLTELTKRLLPGMVKRGHGRIMNVASTAAFMPGPLMAVYYASKAYVLSFSEALSEELRGTGVTVTALCPGPTKTGFQARANMEGSKLVKGDIMDSATVAKIGYEALKSGKPMVIPGMLNRISAMAPRFLPRSVMPRIVKSAQAKAEA